MAGGKMAIFNLQGKVTAANELVVVNQAVSGTPKTGTLANLQGVVDANNALKVTFG